MQHQCKVTVLDTKVFNSLQFEYLADPQSGPCPVFREGDEFLFKRIPGEDDFWNFGRDLRLSFPCAEAWDCISRYIYTALQGGSIMRGWTNDDRMMVACCNDGTRPVIFKIERIDIPETEAEAQWLAQQNFINTKADAYTGAEQAQRERAEEHGHDCCCDHDHHHHHHH